MDDAELDQVTRISSAAFMSRVLTFPSLQIRKARLEQLKAQGGGGGGSGGGGPSAGQQEQQRQYAPARTLTPKQLQLRQLYGRS